MSSLCCTIPRTTGRDQALRDSEEQAILDKIPFDAQLDDDNDEWFDAEEDLLAPDSDNENDGTPIIVVLLVVF